MTTTKKGARPEKPGGPAGVEQVLGPRVAPALVALPGAERVPAAVGPAEAGRALGEAAPAMGMGPLPMSPVTIQ
ncbi:MAG TPA: hypothetical protein VIM73_22025 [Polyangiaceae bacterium]